MSANKNYTALHKYASRGNLAGVMRYLSKYPERINEESILDGRQTAIIWSAKIMGLSLEDANKKFEVFKFLLEQGADPNIIDDLGRNALHNAVENHNIKATKLLVSSRKININDTDGLGYTSLNIAALKKDYAICEFLLQQPGIDINRYTLGIITPILSASGERNSKNEAEREELFKLFIDYGADYKIEGRTESGNKIAPLDDFSKEAKARLTSYIKEHERKIIKAEPQTDIISGVTGFLGSLLNSTTANPYLPLSEDVDVNKWQKRVGKEEKPQQQTTSNEDDTTSVLRRRNLSITSH